jgi:bifunctional DNA-binding transcriptional regulator/antitoxin component of YhaV-PrlF toxin-antitoxin module
MLKCHTTYEVYWGSIFVKDKIYVPIKTINKTLYLIKDIDAYYDKITLIANSRSHLRQGLSQENIKKDILGYMTHKEIRSAFTIEVTIPFYVIKGDDGSSETICKLKSHEVLERFNTNKSTQSLSFVDDYFDLVSELRDEKINNIL